MRMYAPHDAVALMLSSTLARTYGAGLAASLMRAFGNVLLVVMAQAEASATDVAFAVIDLVHDDGRRAYLCSGDAELGNSPAAQGFVAERVTTVNVSRIIRAVRDGAARIGPT